MVASKKPFPGKAQVVREFFTQNPLGTSGECRLWIDYTYGVKIRTKRISTIRKNARIATNEDGSIPRITITKGDIEAMNQNKSENPIVTTTSTTDNSNTTQSNGSEPKKAAVVVRLTHVSFYKVCEVLKEHKQKFIDEKPNLPKAAEMLTQLSGVEVSSSSMAEIKDATGVDWQVKYAPPKRKRTRDFAIRTLATSLLRLYRKMGEEVPSALIDLYEDEAGRKPVGVKVTNDESVE